MSEIPKHILAQIPTLAAEGMPAQQIAFMLRLSPEVIEAELAKLTTTPVPQPVPGNGEAPNAGEER
jgi:hypothetical protein